MIPKIFINLHFNFDSNKIEIIDFSEEFKIFPNQDRCFFLPDMISNDNLIITWLMDINLSEEKIEMVLETLTELGMYVGHLLNKAKEKL